MYLTDLIEKSERISTILLFIHNDELFKIKKLEKWIKFK